MSQTKLTVAMDSAEANLSGRLAEGLWQVFKEVVLVRQRLENFVFQPETDSVDKIHDGLADLARNENKLGQASRELVLRLFRVALEAENFSILLALKGKTGVTQRELARVSGLSDLLLGEKVKDLSQVGLVSHCLETNGVEMTALGEGLIGFIEETAAELLRRAAERLPTLIGK